MNSRYVHDRVVYTMHVVIHELGILLMRHVNPSKPGVCEYCIFNLEALYGLIC